MSGSRNRKHIVVLGAGVIGLTTANVLQQRLPGKAEVVIIADEFPSQNPMSLKTLPTLPPSADFASMWAGAHYRPIPYIPLSHPEYARLSGAQQQYHSQLAFENHLARRTAAFMKNLASSTPQAGVEIVPAEEYLEQPPTENRILRSGDIYASDDDTFRVWDAHELDNLNHSLDQSVCQPVKWACEYQSYVINVQIYCHWLLESFIDRGGRIVQRRVNNLAEAFNLTGSPISTSKPAAIVVNCTGQSAGLTVDPKIRPIRGQTVLVKQQYHATKTRQCADGTWSFLIPRPLGGGTIIGGTKQIGDVEDQPRPEECRKLLQNAVKYYPDFVGDVSKFEVVRDNAGRRPWREGGLRIEIDTSSAVEKGVVVHGYGAGGRGYELSWGAAEKISSLVEKCLALDSRL